MNKTRFLKTGVLLSGFLVAASLPAANVLGPSDVIYAVDLNVGSAPSSPGGEQAANVLDGNTGSKYLNFGNNWSGFIVTPGSSTVRSMRLSTANDATERDPAYYLLYGTTDPITSASQGRGLNENWTLISGGALSLPNARQDSSTVVNVANNDAYTSYKLVFPNVKNGSGGIMQIADVQLYDAANAGGTPILASGQPIVAVDQTGRDGSSRYPANEAPKNAIDGNTGTKYLNFGEDASGFIVVPSSGPSIVTGLEMWTANDATERDPVGFSLYGHKGSVAYGDNSTGDLDTWTLITSGNLNLPLDRFTSGGLVSFDNQQTYDAYRFIVDSVRNGGAANSMQFSEIQLYGVPEPSTIAMSVVTLGFAGFAVWRRRRA